MELITRDLKLYFQSWLHLLNDFFFLISLFFVLYFSFPEKSIIKITVITVYFSIFLDFKDIFKEDFNKGFFIQFHLAKRSPFFIFLMKFISQIIIHVFTLTLLFFLMGIFYIPFNELFLYVLFFFLMGCNFYLIKLFLSVFMLAGTLQMGLILLLVVPLTFSIFIFSIDITRENLLTCLMAQLGLFLVYLPLMMGAGGFFMREILKNND